MRFRVVYRSVEEPAQRRELAVEAVDEGGAYDRAMEEMGENETLVEVSPLPS
jgi:hypothetical protein